MNNCSCGYEGPGQAANNCTSNGYSSDSYDWDTTVDPPDSNGYKDYDDRKIISINFNVIIISFITVTGLIMLGFWITDNLDIENFFIEHKNIKSAIDIVSGGLLFVFFGAGILSLVFKSDLLAKLGLLSLLILIALIPFCLEKYALIPFAWVTSIYLLIKFFKEVKND